VGRCAFALCIRQCCQQFFQWYNTEHRHAGIALMTPHTVHHGHAVEPTQRRVVTLTAAFAANPNRFKQVAPTPPALPSAAWINPPKQNLTSTKRTEIAL
jgi:putative transposase